MDELVDVAGAGAFGETFILMGVGVEIIEPSPRWAVAEASLRSALNKRGKARRKLRRLGYAGAELARAEDRATIEKPPALRFPVVGDHVLGRSERAPGVLGPMICPHRTLRHDAGIRWCLDCGDALAGSAYAFLRLLTLLVWEGPVEIPARELLR